MVDQRFSEWLTHQEGSGNRFTPEQKEWLTMIKEQVATSLSIGVDDFEYAPFYEKGGAVKVYQLFGQQLNGILEEISKFTKVKEHYLKAIEEDQYELLPAVLYVKGFLSVYAKYLTLNPKDILLQYENYLKSLIPPEPSGLPQQAPPKKKSVRAWFFCLISVVSLFPIIHISYPTRHPVSPSPTIRQDLRYPEIYPAQQKELLSQKDQDPKGGKIFPICPREGRGTID